LHLLVHVVTVAAFKQGPPSDVSDVQSGAGGFQLMAYRDCLLGISTRRPAILGMAMPRSEVDSIHFVSMRRWPVRTSVPEPHQPTTPTISPVPDSLTAAAIFIILSLMFAATESPQRNPWELLARAGDEIR